jgi:hypothetical protein
VLILNGLFGDCFGQVDGEKHGIAIPLRREEWSLEEEACVVKGFVC